jgi:hypothetical protein
VNDPWTDSELELIEFLDSTEPKVNWEELWFLVALAIVSVAATVVLWVWPGPGA